MPNTNDNTPQCLVVMYHYVHERRCGTGVGELGPHTGVHALSPDAFAAQLDQLCDSFEPIDWPTFYAATQDRATLPRRSFLLTFDDGLSDHARHVAPLLESRGLRGMFFVPGAVLTTRRLLAAHTIHLLLSRLGEERFEDELRRIVADEPDGAEWIRVLDGTASSAASPQPFSFLCVGSTRLRDTSTGEKSRGLKPAAQNTRTENALADHAYHYESPVRARLKTWLTFQLPIPLRNRVVGDLFEQHIGSLTEWGSEWYLSWDGLSAMQSRGHTIGGHGFVHEPYARLNPRAQEEDMIQCARTLSKGLPSDIRPFSYPYGSHDQSTIEACRRAGFAQAFSTESRWVSTGDDSLRLPRIDTIHIDAHLPKEALC